MELYRYILNLGENIPISVELLPVDSSLPMEEKIEEAVKRLRNHRSGGPSGMRAKHLKMWLAAAKKAAKEATSAGEETTEGNNRGGGQGTYGVYRAYRCV